MCIAVVLAVAAYLGVLVTSAVAGDRAWREGDHAAAERWFRVADRIDVVERWKAPYDVGVAVFSQGRWLEAAELFGRARTDVPQHSLCRVALNEALALEVLGDHLEEADDPAGAKARWARAQQVLAEAQGCSTDEADAADADGESSTSEGAGESRSSDDSEGDSAEEGEDGAEGDSEGESADEGEGDSEGDASADGGSEAHSEGEAKPSEADQLQQAAQRLREKLSGAPRGEAEPQAEASPEDKAAHLEKRGTGAARRRAVEQDNSAPTEGGRSAQPTW
ncbi:hypothetical protein [Nocardioides marmotae]|uniref:Tetratricopeptide repeat protein n=1 Tax=Nocardioides marmotae TaxID=2663857 RepID=A0A6I3IZ36_9ACTN|nr:hypothetical protein [Nocardioides marmotae]MCR6030713.1 hypothetical protein [Gordonia jinghuaiqii]MBC9734019.1 hypothetical protein [Nocardioides marmotae]MTB85122.1 hypothetical protein [Nocardioides marmotae]MTB94347.1 hypothetical protein [Nocardioides marmotae]QKE01625.1 hypothetical protein HPC71_11440 [Nocardioides marmotae]